MKSIFRSATTQRGEFSMNHTESNTGAALKRIEREWERAAERAATEGWSTPELEAHRLHEAAGLRVQSGVSGGEWTHTYSCSTQCTEGMCSPP
jgi:hypothetical protein